MSSSFLPLNAKQDVRPGTRNPGTFDSTLINSSVIPSLKYSSFLSALMFTNGSTLIDLLGSTSDSSLIPSGVISNAHEKISATGKPKMMTMINIFITQNGASKAGKKIDAAWINSHATTAYATATL